MNKIMIQSIPEKELLELPFFKNRGKHFIGRAFHGDNQSNKELLFSNAIKEFHERSGLENITGHDKKELEAGFAVFQWLVTSIGSGVLDGALESIGKKIIDIE